MDEAGAQRGLLDLTAEIVAAYAGHNAVAINELPGVITQVFEALRGVGMVEPDQPAATDGGRCHDHGRPGRR